jgi:outer membrane biogenesis lipoprotein LolB
MKENMYYPLGTSLIVEANQWPGKPIAEGYNTDSHNQSHTTSFLIQLRILLLVASSSWMNNLSHIVQYSMSGRVGCHKRRDRGRSRIEWMSLIAKAYLSRKAQMTIDIVKKTSKTACEAHSKLQWRILSVALSSWMNNLSHIVQYSLSGRVECHTRRDRGRSRDEWMSLIAKAYLKRNKAYLSRKA